MQQLRSAGATERRCKLLDVCSMMQKSLWDLVRISEAGMLETILHMLEATDVQDDELIATSLHMLGLLGSHSITPNQLREHLALFTRGGLTCRLLQPQRRTRTAQPQGRGGLHPPPHPRLQLHASWLVVVLCAVGR